MNELTSVNILANLESEIASSGISITDDEKENLYALAKAIGGAYGQLSSIDLYTSSGIKLTLKIDQTQTSDLEFTLPKQDGTAGQALVTDGNGNLSFDTVGGSISVKDEGVVTVNPATSINFKGAGVTVTDAGGGVADVDIPGGGGGGGTVTSVSQGDGITATPNPIVGAGSIAVDSTVARRNSANTFTTGNQTMQVLALPEQGATPATVANTGMLYTIDVNGFTVLHWIDPDGIDYHVTRDAFMVVRNTSGSNMFKGQVVTIDGSTGQTPTIKLAKADADTTMPCVGMLIENINNNNFGRVVLRGRVSGLNTALLSEGDIVYVSASSAGDYTTTAPSHPYLKQAIGLVVYQHITQGAIMITPGDLEGHGYGTHENTWIVGDALSGAKVVRFKNVNQGDLSWNPTASRTVTIPDASGTIVLYDQISDDFLLIGA